VTLPSAQAQLDFLSKLQRVFAEGDFVATYKFALLLALADLALERGDDSGDALKLPTRLIAERFARTYWRQVEPYQGAEILRHSTGTKGEAIPRILREGKARLGDTLRDAVRNPTGWNSLVSLVDVVVRSQPLWKLQRVGGEVVEFLYPNAGRGIRVTLFPGVAWCLRHHYELIVNLVRGAWVGFVRKLNVDVLGRRRDVEEFLFGSKRAYPEGLSDILRDLQKERCFYCAGLMTSKGHVDHFVPWSRYSYDLGHNFVLAHVACNERKSDRLPGLPHLAAWLSRNSEHDRTLVEAFDRLRLLHDLPVSLNVARSIYRRFHGHGWSTWIEGKRLESLPVTWESHFHQIGIGS
jgi:hypothetical protein